MKNLRSSLLFLSVLAALSTATEAHAVTISALLYAANINTVTFPSGPWRKTDDLIPIGSLDFTSTPGQTLLDISSMPALASMNFSLTLGGLATQGGAPGFDTDNITLSIAGIDTGIKLNGYTDSAAGQNISFNSNIINGALILAQIQLNPSAISVGLIDITADHGNEYYTYGGSFSLTFDSQPIPFTPVQSLGLIVVAGVAGLKRWRRQRLVAVAA